MVKIRLSKVGSKNSLFYKIVAVDEAKKRSGKSLEILGWWNPTKKTIKLEKERIKAWVSNGAQITQAVAKLIEKNA